MKAFRLVLIILFFFFATAPAHAAYDGEGEGPYEIGVEKRSGWSLGTDQGILFFVGNSSNFVNAQYYGTLFFGYNFEGYIMPIIQIGQAFGSLKGFGTPTTFWFMMDGGFRVTPLRTKVRPFLEGTGGFYVLSFTDLGSPVNGELNFTFLGRGGIEVEFGRSALTVGGGYRGFINSGLYLQGVEVTLGYRFQF